MFKFSELSIKIKLRFILSMCILLMLFTSSSILLINSYISNKSILTDEVNALAEIVSLAVVPSVIFDNRKEANQTLKRLKAHNNIVFTEIILKDQQQFAHYQKKDIKQSIPLFPSYKNCKNTLFSLHFLFLCKPLIFDNINYGQIHFSITLYPTYIRVIKELSFSILGLFLASSFIFLLMERFSTRLTRPILELLYITESVTQEGEYDQRVTINSSDEIGRLGSSFNKMLSRIQFWNDSIHRQKDTLEEQVNLRTTALLDAKDNALILAKKAQQANKAKSDFLSIMSHEIRTPLNAIIGFSDLLKESQLNQEQTEFISIINQSGSDLLNQIDDILDFSKIEAGRMEKDLIWFDLFDLLISVLSSNRHASSKKSLLLEHHIASDLPRFIYGDPQKIRQILYNLLSNAIKFTEHGSVTLQVSHETSGTDSANFFFSIIDTGIGINDKQQVTLFSPFTQTDSSTTRIYGGTGLGLAISKNMATILGGNITLYSTQGEGTEFKVTLPLSLRPNTNHQVKKEPSIALFTNTKCPGLKQQLNQLGYKLDLIDEKQQHLLKAQPHLLAHYALLLFTEETLVQARFWDQEITDHPLVAYAIFHCAKKSIKDQLLNLPIIFVDKDILHLLDQLNGIFNHTDNLTKSDHNLFKHNILLVEDNPVNLLMAQNVLKKIGFKCTSVTNGQQALDLYQTHSFSLILMDCQMPIMDGFKATQEIRKLEKTTHHHTPIIALTANAFKDDQAKCLASGMDGFLSKPFKKLRLLEVISPWLKKDKDLDLAKPENTESCLDKTLLKELIEMDEPGSNKFIREMSSTYFFNAKQLTQEIEKAFINKSTENLRKCAHQLKSSSMNIAAKKLSDLFLQFETLAKQDDLQALINLWPSITEEYRRVNNAYHKLLE